MRYVEARFDDNKREEAYRIYVTEALRMISKSTAGMVGGTYMSRTYMDILKPAPEKPQESADDIVRGITERLHLHVKGGDTENGG